MRDFVKIYSTILDSSVWGESKDVKLLWVTILAMGGEHGHVEASVGGLARRAGLTREECEVALEVLVSPDPDDKSGVDEGRRIRKTERGWSITNHRLYRDFRTDQQIETAERVQRHRAKNKAPVTSVTGNDVTAGSTPKLPVRPELEAEREEDLEPTPPPKDLTRSAGEPPTTLVVVVAGEGSKAPEQPEWHERPNATPCPTDLPEKLIAKGVHVELSQHLKVDADSVVHELKRFRDYWVVGKGSGQSRSFWAGKARQWVIDAAAQNKLTPTGKLQHDARPLTPEQRRRVERAKSGLLPEQRRSEPKSGPQLIAAVIPPFSAAGGDS